MIMKIFYEKNEDIEDDKKNNFDGNGKSKIVQLISGAETYTEIYNYNNEFEAFFVDWNKFKEQRFIDTHVIVEKYEAPNYIPPEPFQQIEFTNNIENSTRINTIGSDIDMILIVEEYERNTKQPFDLMSEFFGDDEKALYYHLSKLDNVKNIQKVNTRIPLIELSYLNIDFDIVLILLPTEIPNTPNWIEKVLENEKNLAIGDRKILPLASYKANEFILEKIPKEDLRAKNFRFAIIAMKIWAKIQFMEIYLVF
uniref:Uncharacterized protein n=1 Tax=Meloidogyne javanica TaxID=6303 RepID=A0A915LQ20_MELJA